MKKKQLVVAVKSLQVSKNYLSAQSNKIRKTRNQNLRKLTKMNQLIKKLKVIKMIKKPPVCSIR